MLKAISNNNLIKPEPKTVGICPFCKLPVKSKCGKVKIWHWAHINKKECKYSNEPETDWHRE